MRVGAHASIAGGVPNAVDAQLDYGGNCGQVFSRSPRIWREPRIDDPAAKAFRERSRANDIDPWVVHASYLVNLATPDPDLRERSIESVQDDCDAAAVLGARYVNVHLGAHTGAGVDTGLENAVGALDEVQVPGGVKLLVETDAGAGTKLGGDLDHLAAVVDSCETPLGVCLDTAHLWAAGYDLSTPAAVDATVASVDAAVGVDRVAVVHLNDSKHQRGTCRDEHAHIGEGEIGVDGLQAVINHPGLRDRPFVVETPTEDGRSFAWNIERVKELRTRT